MVVITLKAEATDVDASLFETDISVDKPQPSHAYGGQFPKSVSCLTLVRTTCTV